MNTLTDKQVLVTGGAGFIGSELCRQLKTAGARVRIVDNLVNGKASNVEEILDATCHLERADIRDYPTMEKLMRGVDYVFHLACLGVRHSIHSPVENHQVNAEASLHLLRLARVAGGADGEGALRATAKLARRAACRCHEFVLTR
jgi:UDP-glucose 4-epimerase